MEPDRWDDDEALLADLTDAVREVAPLSARVAEQARGALVWRTVDIDLQLATLSFDSALEGAGRTRAGDDGSRVLVFQSAPLAVEVELQADRIVGQLTPATGGEVTLESPDGTRIQVTADEFGFFVVPRVPPGAVRLLCETPDAKLTTGWFQR